MVNARTDFIRRAKLYALALATNHSPNKHGNTPADIAGGLYDSMSCAQQTRVATVLGIVGVSL